MNFPLPARQKNLGPLPRRGELESLPTDFEAVGGDLVLGEAWYRKREKRCDLVCVKRSEETLVELDLKTEPSYTPP